MIFTASLILAKDGLGQAIPFFLFSGVKNHSQVIPIQVFPKNDSIHA